MPSPFPGMNPYLEQNDTWEDFHQEFLTRARSQLANQYTDAEWTQQFMP